MVSYGFLGLPVFTYGIPCPPSVSYVFLCFLLLSCVPMWSPMLPFVCIVKSWWTQKGVHLLNANFGYNFEGRQSGFKVVAKNCVQNVAFYFGSFSTPKQRPRHKKSARIASILMQAHGPGATDMNSLHTGTLQCYTLEHQGESKSHRFPRKMEFR